MVNKEIRKIDREIPVSVTCDHCGRTCDISDFNDFGVSFKAQHYEWDNDSCESIEKYDACTTGCYIELLRKAVGKFRNYSTSAEIDDKPFVFVEKLTEPKKEGVEEKKLNDGVLHCPCLLEYLSKGNDNVFFCQVCGKEFK